MYEISLNLEKSWIVFKREGDEEMHSSSKKGEK